MCNVSVSANMLELLVDSTLIFVPLYKLLNVVLLAGVASIEYEPKSEYPTSSYESSLYVSFTLRADKSRYSPS